MYVCLGREGLAKSAHGKRGVDISGWPGDALGTICRDAEYAMSMRKEMDSYVCYGHLERHENCLLPFIFFETSFVLCFIFVKKM